MKTLVLIPCYNEEANIVRVVERLKSTCPDVDYLVINDCSRDRSEEILRENGYNYLTLPVNLGIGGGVQCGYRYARANGYDITVQMDGDGQHDPADLNKVVGPVARGKWICASAAALSQKRAFRPALCGASASTFSVG